MKNEELREQDIIDGDEGISLTEIWQHIKEHLIAIIVIVIIFTSGGFAFDSLKKPEYNSKATLLVQYESGSSNLNSDLSFSNQISNTFVEFIKKDIVLKPVAEEFNLSVNKLRNNLIVSNSGKSLIIDIKYNSEDKNNTQSILNAIINQTLSITNQKKADGKPVYTMLKDNLQVLSYADEAQKVSNTMKILIISFLVGLIASCLYVLACVITDKRFKSNEEIERLLGLPVLAGIPLYEVENEKGNK